MSLIQPGMTILFQGDSITDAGRDRNNNQTDLGRGYAMLAAGQLLASRPADDIKFINRGISGNRIVDLYARWKIDGINLKPDLISILIGVNDTWHEFNYQNGVEVPRFEKFYRDLLIWTRDALSKTKIVLCEPFYLRTGVVTKEWEPDIDARIAVTHQLAAEFKATLVPFHQMFEQAAKKAPPQYWASDGVHPTLAGHTLMAQEWIKCVA
ncbi:MAG: SGNH/GDSL hydrolase family protein [Phycisphaeraceae bacterium]